MVEVIDLFLQLLNSLADPHLVLSVFDQVLNAVQELPDNGIPL